MSPKIVNFGRDSNELSEEMNFHAASAYALHLLTARSTAGYGVHSPLMFRFITVIIGGKSDRKIMAEVLRLRREMLSDRRVVRVRDLGAGSAVMRDGTPGSRREPAKLPGEQNAPPAAPMGDVDLYARQDPSLTGGEQNVRPAAPMGDVDLYARQDPSLTGCEQNVRPAAPKEDVDRDLRQNPSRKGEEQNTRQDASINGIERSIRQIASVAAVPKREAALLARIAANLDSIMERATLKPSDSHHEDRPGKETLPDERQGEETLPDNRPVILEMGTSLGISTLALALGAPDRKVITIEGCPELATIAAENLRRHRAVNAEVLNMEFSQALNHLKDRGIKVDMAFIDGNHRGGALTEYIHEIRKMGDEMIIVADDIHLNRDMILAWKSLAMSQHAPRIRGGSGTQTIEQQDTELRGTSSSRTSLQIAPGIMPAPGVNPAPGINPTPGSPATGKTGTASLETFRLGIFFCLHNLTPGRYRIRY